MDDNEADNRGTNGSSLMIPLEIEEEMMSLYGETAGSMNVVSKLTFRVKSAKQREREEAASTGFRGLLRTKTAYIVRNIILLAGLAFLVFLLTDAMDSTIENISEEDEDIKDPRGPHQSSFGGVNNPGSVVGLKAHITHSENEFHGLPMDNIGERVPSISKENDDNDNGHYWHDPHQSPWSSSLYNRSQTELEKEQLEFLLKQNETKLKYGSWDLVDPYFKENGTPRPTIDFAHKNSDVPTYTFETSSWQTDREYVRMLIEEAKKLIDRMKEGIYEYYGHPKNDHNGVAQSNETLKAREALFGIIFEDFTVNSLGEAIDVKTKKKLQGVAYINKNGWEALQRKLLHAIITEGDFYAVLVGDANAAGHGNNFLQSSIMRFHYIMEPVLDFLGIRLISRNMAMKDTPTVLSALAGGDINGEADILLYSSKVDEPDGSLDLLYKQSVLSGEIVPIILTSKPGQFVQNSKGQPWMGNLQPGSNVCGTKVQDPCNFDAFNSACWVDRTDVVPPTPQRQEIAAESYDGYHVHALEGTKLALLVLNALDAALDTWVKGIEKDGFPLIDKYWHVGETYHQVRESVRESGNWDEESQCERIMGDLRMICRVEMHGFTEFTPRITPHVNGLTAILSDEMNVVNMNKEYQFYKGIDLLPLSWKVPNGQVDVHSIAISTSAPSPEQSKSNDYDDDIFVSRNDDYNDDEMSRTLNDYMPGRAIQVLKSDIKMVPGSGWTLNNPVLGFCDGSSQSTCGRNTNSSCLLAGHNSYHSSILGDGLSGWLIMNIVNVKEGIILVRLDTELIPTVDPGTSKVNNGGPSRLLPDDFLFDFAINENTTTWSLAQFHEAAFQVEDDVTIYPLMFDNHMYERMKSDEDEGITVQLAIRMRSSVGRGVVMSLTHLYYA